MAFIDRYIRYLKNNPERYWFKRKAYGWGWVPATWQGFATLIVFLGIFVLLFVPFVNNPPQSSAMIAWFVIKMLLWALALTLVCYLTGEPPRWQWGIPSDSEIKK